MKKNIIITGTSRGIGLELALEFASKGHQVLAISRKANDKLLGNSNITCFLLDISKDEELEQVSNFLEKSWKNVSILIHNAGVLVNKPFLELSKNDFKAVYDVNVFSVARLTQICIPYMQKGSHVVTLSSMGGIQGSMKFPGLAAYSSSKGAVITLSELLAEEFKEQGISFNVLALGAVNTEMLQEAFPGYEALVSAKEMAQYIYEFAISSNKLINGKVFQISATTP